MGGIEIANYKKHGMISDVMDRIIIPNPTDKASPGDKETVVMSSENTKSDSSHSWVSMSSELASTRTQNLLTFQTDKRKESQMAQQCNPLISMGIFSSF